MPSVIPRALVNYANTLKSLIKMTEDFYPHPPLLQGLKLKAAAGVLAEADLLAVNKLLQP